MATLIKRNYLLLPVINRFDIQLGFRDKTIHEICNEKKINTTFFLAIVNTYHNPNYFPEHELLNVTVSDLVSYLRKTHNFYIQFELPKLETLLMKVISSCKSNCSELNMIENFYQKYKVELIQHIDIEEKKVFPYALEIEQHSKDKIPFNSAYSMHDFEEEHNNVEEKLNDLKNLIIKYVEPKYDITLCNDFLITLAQFEKDIKDHARIEDKILVPRVEVLEKELKNVR